MRRSLLVPVLSLLAPALLAGGSVAAQSHGPTAKPASNVKGAPAGPHWAYEGAEGPHAWGRIDAAWRACSVGREQSPIDLGGTVMARQGRIAELFVSTPLILFNNGHTVQAALEKASTLTIDGTPYASLQFHFHHPSEHTVRGKAYPAELHLVHRSAKGELAVLGIFIEIGARENPAFEALIAKLPRASGDSVPFKAPVDLAALLEDRPGADEAVYAYHGSLTTPPCSEGVRWTVRERPVAVSFRQMQRLVAVLGESARPVQPVFDRR